KARGPHERRARRLQDSHRDDKPGVALEQRPWIAPAKASCERIEAKEIDVALLDGRRCCTLAPVVAAMASLQIIEAQGQRSLNVPVRSAESLEVALPPVRQVRVDFRGEPAVLPLGRSHDVIVVVAKDISLDAVLTLNAGIVVGIVRDIADVQNAKRPAEAGIHRRDARIDGKSSRTIKSHNSGTAARGQADRDDSVARLLREARRAVMRSSRY